MPQRQMPQTDLDGIAVNIMEHKPFSKYTVNFNGNQYSECCHKLQVKQPWGEVVGNVVLPSLHISDPLVGNGVCKIKQVEHIQPDP